MSQMPNENQNASAPPGASPGSQPPQELVRPENDEAKTMGMLCHLLAIFTWFIGPLIIWLTKKDQSKFVDQQGKEALNFALCLSLAAVALGIMQFMPYVRFLTGCLGVPALYAVNVIFNIMATIEVNKGNPYRYPFSYRFIK